MILPNSQIELNHREEAGDVGPAENGGLAAVRGEKIIDNPKNAVEEEEPHSEKVPHPRAGQPPTQSEFRRKGETPDRRGIVDLETASNHNSESDEIYPVSQSDNDWMVVFPLGSRGAH